MRVPHWCGVCAYARRPQLRSAATGLRRSCRNRIALYLLATLSLRRHSALAFPALRCASATTALAAALRVAPLSAAQRRSAAPPAALGLVHDTGAGGGGDAAQRVAVLFTGDRVEARDAAVRRLSSAAGAATAVAARLPPHTRVLAVAPARYVSGVFAAYDGWLPPDALDARGEPATYAADGSLRAWRSLAELLRSAGVPLADAPPPPQLLLLAFSKGAVVVNQLLAELAAAPEAADDDEQCADGAQSRDVRAASPAAEDAARCMAALRAAHLLDAGALRRGAAHLTDPHTLAALAARLRRAGARLHIHGTPRQWRDARRPWLAQEAAACARCASRQAGYMRRGRSLTSTQHAAARRALGDAAVLHRYFEDDSARPLLRMHFQILDVFDGSDAGDV
jgi:hypothetical protein